MAVKLLWFDSLRNNSRPNIHKGLEFQIASSSELAQYGTVARLVGAWDLTPAETPGMVVSMLSVLAEEMLAHRIKLPYQLIEMTINRGVSSEAIFAVYPAFPSVCVVGDRAVLGFGWSFGNVLASVAIIDDFWFALICPAEEPAKLVTWP